MPPVELCIPEGGPGAPPTDRIECRIRLEWEEVDGKATA